MGLDYHHTDGKDGKIAELVREALIEYMSQNYPDIYSLTEQISVRMPWARMFETDIKIKLIDKEVSL